MSRIRFVSGLAAFTLVALTGATAPAFFHLWRFTEFFSNADGTVQFIELQSSGPSETQANGAVFSSASTGKSITLTTNLSGSTSNKRLLLATAGFASLPGAVPPDFPTIPLPANFFNPAGDTVSLFHHQPIDSKTFSSVPTDGVMSRVYPSNTLAINSPTNFAGQSGSVNLSTQLAGDHNDDGTVNAADYVAWRKLQLPESEYTAWRTNFGRRSGGSGSYDSFAVPEPSTLALVIGAILLAPRRNYSRRR